MPHDEAGESARIASQPMGTDPMDTDTADARRASFRGSRGAARILVAGVGASIPRPGPAQRVLWVVVRRVDRARVQRPARLRAALLCLALGLCAGIPVPARATAPEADAVAAWVGRYCTPQGCRGSLESALGNAAGFGAAALAAAFVARRRRS
jgi:MYXO-CTERM domain-containing protein